MEQKVMLYRCKEEIVNDAYDRAVVNIYLQKEKKGYKSFLLCGSEPGVGTTSISVEMAISLSISGWKTIFIDGDLRKGNKYKRLNETVKVGLSDYVSGRYSLDECIYETNWEGLSYIPCGDLKEESPVRALCSMRMDIAMRQLQEEYDFIIMDVPSINSSVDAKILAVKADASILVVALNETKKNSVAEAHKQLLQAGGNVIGVIENKVPLEEYKKYIKEFDYFKDKKFAHMKQDTGNMLDQV